MNIFLYLFEKFFEKQKWNMAGLLILSLVLSFLYTNISSKINANIIRAINSSDLPDIFHYFWLFVGISLIYLVILYAYKYSQNNLLTTLTNWVKKEMFEFIVNTNYKDMKNLNFADFMTPITRIAAAATTLINDVITNLIPTIGFLVVITGYLCIKNVGLGFLFLVGNIILFSYLFVSWQPMFDYKKKQEDIVIGNERYILDNLNNIDKVIYRGTAKKEIDILDEKTENCIEYSFGMAQYMTNHMFVMNAGIYAVMFSTMYYILWLFTQKRMNSLDVVTFLTVLIMYRDNISDTVQSLPHNIDLAGRINLILVEFNDMIDNADIRELLKKETEYKPVRLPFDVVTFEDVSFKYSTADYSVFEHYSKDLNLVNKIIGITGPSGKGKSSFVKLILRLHDAHSGKIYIDGVDIQTIDPTYIRENITYVNQNSRLFDRKVLENILYGCKDESKCQGHLAEILKYEKIRELYVNVDLEDTYAGALGENLSGGQRQVANLISGLINPTQILVLDEPTNALDPSLKYEILSLIQHFRSYKKCIMIITHDKDVYQLFDETVEI
jgi:ABC-type multidrug transport system fused ATPase/permease subunit